jgi:uncharacterized damage-inducible protein DinB
MQIHEVVREAFGRIPGIVERVLDDLALDALTWQSAAEANTIGWLLWHLARVQDDHVADLAGEPQVWAEGGWAPRFGLDEDVTDIGYGWSIDQVLTVRPESTQVVEDYLARVTERTMHYLDGLTPDELDRVIDDSWDPPVTAGVRLVSVLSDDLQHAGQAAYVRGLWEAADATDG